MPVYCAAKAGVLSLTFQLAVDYGPENIRVNGLCPGATLSPRVKGYIDSGLMDGKATEELSLLGCLAVGRPFKNNTLRLDNLPGENDALPNGDHVHVF